MTETGMSLGTPHYMSPEQAMGEREITARSDVYALGAVLYEMLTGEPPFTGATAQAVVARVVTESPRPLATAAPHHPAPRRGRGAHRAREAPGRPVRHGRPSSPRRSRTRPTRPPCRCRRRRPRRATASGRRPPARRRWCWRSARRSPWPSAAALWGWLRPAPAPPLTQFSLALRSNQALQPPLPTRRRADRPLAGRPRAGVQRARRRRHPPLAPAPRPARRHADRRAPRARSSPFFSPGRPADRVHQGRDRGAHRVARGRADGDADRQGQLHLRRLGRRRLRLLRGGLGRRPDARHRRGASSRSTRSRPSGRRSRPSGCTCCPAPAGSSSGCATPGQGPADFEIMAMPLPHGQAALARPGRLRPLRPDRASPGGHRRRQAHRHPVRPQEARADRRAGRADRRDRRADRRLQHRPGARRATARWPTPPAARSAPAARSG